MNTLNKTVNCGTIDTKRRVELWGKLIRLVVAILYIVAELSIGYLPPEAKIGKRE
jgi:hypothetical protein